MEEKLSLIDKFIEELAKVDDTDKDFYNLYKEDKTKYNLREYLKYLLTCDINTVLIGEAPGIHGCRHTGIPFTDEKQLLNSDNYYALGSWQRLNSVGDNKETTAGIVWEVLRDRNIVPLMWNSFPFHPYEKDNKVKNRAPNQKELVIGDCFLDRLLKIYDIDKSNVFAVGRKAQNLMDLPNDNYIVHPSYGRKREFIKGIDEKILKKAAE